MAMKSHQLPALTEWLIAITIHCLLPNAPPINVYKENKKENKPKPDFSEF